MAAGAVIVDDASDALFACDVADEPVLMGAAARGDIAAFESLYRRHVGRVHGVIVRLVGGHGARAEGSPVPSASTIGSAARATHHTHGPYRATVASAAASQRRNASSTTSTPRLAALASICAVVSCALWITCITLGTVAVLMPE